MPGTSRRIALTRPVSNSLPRCELTYLTRQPIDVARATAQHGRYEALLESFGFEIQRLPALHDQPDAVFVEDAAIALDELAVVAPMGAASRIPESKTVEEGLARWLPITRLAAPATLDGGDVLRVGRTLFVGESRRTNRNAIAQLTELLAPYDYQVIAVPVRGALHLKSACAFVGANTVLANPHWVDVAPFAGLDILASDPAEPWGASLLYTESGLVMPTGFPRTAATLRTHGFNPVELDLSELRKAEGGPTCLSILLGSASSS